MGKALYRKYRSKSLDEIIGQPHITSTLRNALETGKTSHAYLFTGPRGTGKTSTARILAYALNDLPYDEEASHLDIIEIDAASNRRIDEIRDLRDRVHTAPTSAKYKVYIIDEVHMLTKEAFNALLKTLEEPPAHAIFILATTEAHKLPETITSRTQRYTFKPAQKDVMIAHLRSIADKEGLTIDDDGLALIAQHGEGSFRDSVSMLDQVRGHADSVQLSDVQSMLGIAPDALIKDVVQTLSGGTAGDVVSLLSQTKDQGYSAGQIAKQIAGVLRADLIQGRSQIGSNQVPNLLEKLLSVPTAHDQMANLELALLEIILARNPLSEVPVQIQPTQKQPDPAAVPVTVILPEPPPTPKLIKQPPVPEPISDIIEPLVEDTLPAVAKPTEPSDLDDTTWAAALDTIKRSHNTLYSVARMAVPSFSGDELTLTFSFAFHQKRLNETKNKQVITDIVQKSAGKPVTIVCIVGKGDATDTKSAVDAVLKAPVANDTAVSNISNIFGGAEVLES